MNKKTNLPFIILFFVILSCFLVTQKTQADFLASSNSLRLENWSFVDSGPFAEGNLLFNLGRASVGLPIIGEVLSNPIVINEIPTFENRIITGFLFINLFEFVSIASCVV